VDEIAVALLPPFGEGWFSSIFFTAADAHVIRYFSGSDRAFPGQYGLFQHAEVIEAGVSIRRAVVFGNFAEPGNFAAVARLVDVEIIQPDQLRRKRFGLLAATPLEIYEYPTVSIWAGQPTTDSNHVVGVLNYVYIVGAVP
jgi:hypothetical protein